MDREKICETIGMQKDIREFLEYLYTPFDLEILNAVDDDGIVTEKYRRSWMEHLYNRGVLDKIMDQEGKVGYRAGNIETRLECFIVVEKAYWLSLPQEVRDAINNRYIMNPELWIPKMLNHQEYSESIRPIEECVELLENTNTSYYYLAECNCNNYLMNCDKDKYRVCIHFPSKKPDINSLDVRGIAQRVTKEEALEALLYSEELGLVHKVGPAEENFCNCCSCCCIHHHNTEKYKGQLKGGYIKTPYIIELNREKCIDCGACTKRCPFGALIYADKKTVLCPEECWGCGVCRSVCSQNALQIKKRRASEPEI